MYMPSTLLRISVYQMSCRYLMLKPFVMDSPKFINVRVENDTFYGFPIEFFAGYMAATTSALSRHSSISISSFKLAQRLQ